MSEFTHVSQFLETTFALSFGLVVAVHIVVLVVDLPYHIKQIK